MKNDNYFKSIIIFCMIFTNIVCVFGFFFNILSSKIHTSLELYLTSIILTFIVIFISSAGLIMWWEK